MRLIVGPETLEYGTGEVLAAYFPATNFEPAWGFVRPGQYIYGDAYSRVLARARELLGDIAPPPRGARWALIGESPERE